MFLLEIGGIAGNFTSVCGTTRPVQIIDNNHSGEANSSNLLNFSTNTNIHTCVQTGNKQTLPTSQLGRQNKYNTHNLVKFTITLNLNRSIEEINNNNYNFNKLTNG